MKKTLAAVAVLGAFAGTALAADVTLYGKFDGGLNYTHQKVDGSNSTDSFEARSGQNSGSRFGLKGTEQISDGLTVGFQLESGFDLDNGKLGQGGRIFGREARGYVKTDFGEIGFGRMGGLDSGLGSYDLVGDASVFGTGWGSMTGTMSLFFKGKSDRYDNMISYKSPEFAGLTLVAQASLMRDTSDDGDEGTHLADRYYAIGLGADYGALTGALTFSMQDYAGFADRYTGEVVGDTGTKVSDEIANDSDGYTVTAYGQYDFGVTKVSLGAQYFDNVAQERGSLAPSLGWDEGTTYEFGDVDFGVTGYGVMLGAITPIAGGNLYASLGYADYEASELPDVTEEGVEKADYKVYGVGVGYQYPLSKRTYVYTAASYTQQTKNSGAVNAKDVDTKTTEVMMGLVHNF
ncbi:MAG TPA: porin [Candidatus Aphodousia faecavium]|nr:porin [Candidatus Aphodousia faecavium]